MTRFLLVLLFVQLATALSAHSTIPRPPTPLAEWTLLVYMNGKNNLDPYTLDNLNQMEMWGSTDQVNLVVEWGSLATKSVKRLRVVADNNPAAVTSPVLEDLGNSDMGDYRNLATFLEWGAKNFPAKKYFVVVWNHGYGWHSDDPFDAPTDDISHDETTNHTITTIELGEAFRAFNRATGRKIDLFGADACLMSGVEVAAEIADTTELFMGSQDIEPSTGWPYHHILRRWYSNPGMSGVEIMKIVTEEYVRYYKSGEVEKREVAFSGMDMKAVPLLLNRIQDLRALLMNSAFEAKSKIKDAAHHTFRFDFEDYGDLGVFVKRLSTGRRLGYRFPLELSQLMEQYQRFVLVNAATKEFAQATGASIWMPKKRKVWDHFKTGYASLRFAQATGWDRLLESLLED